MTPEMTVEALAKRYPGAFGNDKRLSYGRRRTQKSIGELFDEPNTLK